MEMTIIGMIATVCFFSALTQSLFSSFILKKSFDLKIKKPYLSKFLHFAGEPEIIFGLWASVFLVLLMSQWGFRAGQEWMDGRNFSEVVFVVVIMVLASTKPITEFAEKFILILSKLLPLNTEKSVFIIVLIVGPLLGSLITEPAAMTSLASQVEGLSEISKYLVVAAGVTGGGLTVIANAPNPAGLAILKEFMPTKGLNPLYLLLSALPPTVIAGVLFIVL